MNYYINQSLMKTLIFTNYFIILTCLLSSKTFYFIWICFEVNTLLFILTMKTAKPQLINSLMKYFITQSLASSLFLLSIILLYYSITFPFNQLMVISMWVKLGFFPFSSWYFQITENLDWTMWFMLNTFQKLPPMWVISNMQHSPRLLFFLLILNAFYSTMEVWNQTSMRWLINSSSLNHFSWMTLSLNSSQTSIWEIYFLSYTFLNFILFKFLIQNSWNSLLTSFNTQKPVNQNLLMIFLLLNFIGLPPFFGFYPKLLVMMKTMSLIMPLILLLTSIFMSILYFYYFLPLMLNSFNLNLNLTHKNTYMYIYFSFIPIILMTIWF